MADLLDDNFTPRLAVPDESGAVLQCEGIELRETDELIL
jgi:hypothetical protein